MQAVRRIASERQAIANDGRLIERQGEAMYRAAQC
jgi:hypothetical protein